MSEFSHIPVMLEPVLAYLLTGPGLYVDGTLGGGGHSEQILARCGQARLIGIDRDLEAIEAAIVQRRPVDTPEPLVEAI